MAQSRTSVVNAEHGKASRVVVIGAGLSGLVAATELVSRGFKVTIVEKARGPGGRMSTRRDGTASFNHGAQYFTAGSPQFKRLVEELVKQGVVQEWKARIAVIEDSSIRPATQETKRFVAVPGMNAMCKQLVQGLPDVRFNWRAVSLQQQARTWHLRSEQGEEIEADYLIVAIPPKQAVELLKQSPAVDDLVHIEMQPCWAVMVTMSKPLLLDWDAAFVNSGPLSWVARQNIPGGESHPENRNHLPECWVLHASTDWSETYLEQDPEWVCKQLLQAAAGLAGASSAETLSCSAHRWRYSIARKPLLSGALLFESDRLVIAGDWCKGSKVEGAFLSGMAAAAHLLTRQSNVPIE